MQQNRNKTPEDYMRQVLDLAVQGAGKVSPNPMVGGEKRKNSRRRLS